MLVFPAITVTGIMMEPVNDGAHRRRTLSPGTHGNIITTGDHLHSGFNAGKISEAIVIDHFDIPTSVIIDIDGKMGMARFGCINRGNHALNECPLNGLFMCGFVTL